MKAISTQGLIAKNLMPYMGVQFDKAISFKVNGETRNFRVFTYQAYNACGLIGPECNGIAIGDENNKCIVCDEICKSNSGYFGMNQTQLDKAEEIAAMPWDQFRDFVNNQPRLRMRLENKEDEPIVGNIAKVKLPVMNDNLAMTAKQKRQVLRDWIRFLQFGCRQKDFTKGLYHHLIMHCSFIAHFNLNGFYFTYFDADDVSDTLRFLNQFDRDSGCASVEYGHAGWLNLTGYTDINNAMVDLAGQYLPALRQHFVSSAA